MPKLTEEQIQAATRARVAQALAHIQEAQDSLLDACNMLSALRYANPLQRRTLKLHDTVKAHWYKVDRLHRDKRVVLDPLNIEALQARIDQASASTGGNRDASTQALSKPDDHPASAGA